MPPERRICGKGYSPSNHKPTHSLFQLLPVEQHIQKSIFSFKPHPKPGASIATMTQYFSSSNPPSLSSEKRTFSGLPVSSNKPVNGPNSQVSQKIRNFFRISSASHDTKDKDARSSDSALASKSEKSSSRQSRFIPHLTRNRSATIVSEGNGLDDHMSPTANMNPYFQFQGPPALRHHNDSSVPPSPPDTPRTPSKVAANSGAHDHQISAQKDELARRLRRVASAPNAQGFFNDNTSQDRPPTSDTIPEAVTQHSNSSTMSIHELPSLQKNLLPVPGLPTPGQIRNSVAFRRTYSSNSIKVRNVEVGPSSFDKIKLIGKGDVGKVYLVREKKSARLYAMKGTSGCFCL